MTGGQPARPPACPGRLGPRRQHGLILWTHRTRPSSRPFLAEVPRRTEPARPAGPASVLARSPLAAGRSLLPGIGQVSEAENLLRRRCVRAVPAGFSFQGTGGRWGLRADGGWLGALRNQLAVTCSSTVLGRTPALPPHAWPTERRALPSTPFAHRLTSRLPSS